MKIGEFTIFQKEKHDWKPVSVDLDGNTRHYTHVLEVCQDTGCEEERVITYNGHHPRHYFMPGKPQEVNDVKR
jgi:hypothetical protein